jgi:hypothetical protein
LYFIIVFRYDKPKTYKQWIILFTSIGEPENLKIL